MITLLKVIFGVILLCGIPGVILGLWSSHKAGQLKILNKHTKGDKKNDR